MTKLNRVIVKFILVFCISACVILQMSCSTRFDTYHAEFNPEMHSYLDIGQERYSEPYVSLTGEITGDDINRELAKGVKYIDISKAEIKDIGELNGPFALSIQQCKINSEDLHRLLNHVEGQLDLCSVPGSIKVLAQQIQRLDIERLAISDPYSSGMLIGPDLIHGIRKSPNIKYLILRSLKFKDSTSIDLNNNAHLRYLMIEMASYEDLHEEVMVSDLSGLKSLEVLYTHAVYFSRTGIEKAIRNKQLKSLQIDGLNEGDLSYISSELGLIYLSLREHQVNAWDKAWFRAMSQLLALDISGSDSELLSLCNQDNRLKVLVANDIDVNEKAVSQLLEMTNLEYLSMQYVEFPPNTNIIHQLNQKIKDLRYDISPQ